MADVVYVGAVAPEAYVLDLVPGASGVDLSTVTAAVFVVREPSGPETTWVAAVANQTASTLTLTHIFDGPDPTPPAFAGDIAEPGEFVIYASLAIPSGTVRSEPQPLTARGRFEV